MQHIRISFLNLYYWKKRPHGFAITHPSHFRLSDFIIITTIFSSGLSSTIKAQMESKK